MNQNKTESQLMEEAFSNLTANRKVNREYKDNLFKIVFRSKKDLLTLYNALNDSNYENEDDLIVVTLEDVVYINVKNDLSFIVGDTLNLYEHQSTLSGNLPLRAWLYLAKQYEAYIEIMEEDIHAKTSIKLPLPQAAIFYNGDEKADDIKVLKLSDSFIIPEGRKREDFTPAVECL